jgi:1-acyl-sn-glycerol-3-phosphate acyltransferase
MRTPPIAPHWVRRLVGPLVRRWLCLAVEGSGRVPADGPVIIAATHRSHGDVLALSAATARPLTFLGSAHIGAIPIAGRILRRFGLVDVNRGTADFEALDRCLHLLEVGAALVVFPEGGRSRDRRVYRPRSGVARLAAAARCPVVPASVVVTAELWPPDGRPHLRSGRVVVRFGVPLEPPTADARSRRSFNDRLHAALVDLSGEEPAPILLRRTSA